MLNQRYVTRTSLATGATRRMLRLAIGSKSQLCAVADGFRVVVVVEQRDACVLAPRARALRARARKEARAGSKIEKPRAIRARFRAA